MNAVNEYNARLVEQLIRELLHPQYPDYEKIEVPFQDKFSLDSRLKK